MIFAVIFCIRLNVLKYSILKRTGFLGVFFFFFFCKTATVALSGSIPVRVYVIRKVVDKVFSVKTCDFECGFPSTPGDPEQSRLADLWKAAGKMRGVVRVVMVKGARAGELVVRGALIIRLNSQRPLIALLVLRSHFPCFSPVKTALSNEPSR